MNLTEKKQPAAGPLLFFLACAFACAGCLGPVRKSLAPVPVVPFSDGRNFMLYDELHYRKADAGVVTVPRGFVTDFASVPRSFWSGYLPTGPYQWAAVVHDYLYWTHTGTRKEADDLFLDAMEESGVGLADRAIIYNSVRLGGGTAWENNRRERERGLTRVVPKKYRNIPPHRTWDEYRRELYEAGVRP